MFSNIDFTDHLQMIEEEEIEEVASPWGNTFSSITPEQIDELYDKKIIYVDDLEYGHFIKLKVTRATLTKEDLEEFFPSNTDSRLNLAERVKLVENGYNKALDDVIKQLEAEINGSDKYIREYENNILQRGFNGGLRHSKRIVEQIKEGKI